MTLPSSGPAALAGDGRRAGMDLLRVAVVVGLVLFHSALVFDARDDFYVKNAETTGLTMVISVLGVLWAMPLLFYLAGLAARHSLGRRGPAGYAAERLRRIAVPLVFATVAIVPVPQWLRLRADPAYRESYPEFLPRFFHVELDLAEFPFVLQGEHFETGHLWFLVLLLTFSLLLSLAVRWPPSPGLGERIAGLARVRGAMLLPALPLVLISMVLGLEEEYAGWSRWAYLVFFCCGFAFAADERFRRAVRRDLRVVAACGLALFAAGVPVLLSAGDDAFTSSAPLAVLGRALYGAAGWCWMLTIVGLLDRVPARSGTGPSGTRPDAASEARPPGDPPDVRYADPAARPDAHPGVSPDAHPGVRPAVGSRRGDGGLRGYLAEAVLPLYVLHQPIVVAVAYQVVRWQAPIAVKYVVIVACSLVLMVLAYDLLVRRTRLTRFLFGMRPRKPGAPNRAPAAGTSRSRGAE
ncbi:acyltransferase [Streptosporangium sp. NPDC023615]|uniref:acyltransferase family protein n=1 Tax=Streptosporangium sp. NPDC023615 TaxID=3154794 RepID=UPI00344A4C6A